MPPPENCPEIVVRGERRLTATDLPGQLRASTDGDVLIDLRRLTFIDPLGLVSLAVVTDHAVAAHHRVTFLSPEDPDLASYVARMRLSSHLDQLGVRHALPRVREQQLGARLVELHRFDGSEGLERVVEALVQTFLTEQRDVQPLYAALQELAENVIQHSGSGHGYAALQRFPSSDRVEFAVGDGGVGLRTRLEDTLPVRDDRMAIVQAARTHVTTSGQRGRGRGIGQVIEIAGRRHGSVTMMSGSAHGVFHRGNIDPQLTTSEPGHPGTLVHVCLTL